MNSGKHYSQHIFMYPFKWDYLTRDCELKDIPLEERWTLIDLKRILDRSSKWKAKPFSFRNELLEESERVRIYNELNFFHDYVREVMYDREGNSKNDIIKYFEYDCPDDWNYCIEVLQGKATQSYKLRIGSISLHAVNTGVAVLTYTLYNWDYPEPEQILQINEFGRRTYPQFLGEHNPFTDDTRRVSLAASISIRTNKSHEASAPSEEDFIQYDNLNKINEVELFHPPDFIRFLFNDDFIFSSSDCAVGKVLLRPAMDDRMFNTCWYGNAGISDRLKVFKDDVYAYLQDDFWYSFVFADPNDPTCQSKTMMKELLKTHTYDRWIEKGTLYGMSRETLVCLTHGFIEKPPTDVHMRTIYYQIAVLCLIQRASTLRFSSRVTQIADLSRNTGGRRDQDRILVQIDELYKNYIEFVNKLYFREVTPQIQGIEIYDKLQQVMRIERDVKDLDKEIDELHRYSVFRQQEQQNWQSRLLNIIAFIALPLAVFAGFLGMNTMPDSYDLPLHLFGGSWYWPFWISLVMIIGLTIIIVIFVDKKLHLFRKKSK